MNRPMLHKVKGHDGRAHLMTLLRSNGDGVGQFSNVTRKMSGSHLQHIRARAEHVVYEAKHRLLILKDPFKMIAERVFG